MAVPGSARSIGRVFVYVMPGDMPAHRWLQSWQTCRVNLRVREGSCESMHYTGYRYGSIYCPRIQYRLVPSATIIKNTRYLHRVIYAKLATSQFGGYYHSSEEAISTVGICLSTETSKTAVWAHQCLPTIGPSRTEAVRVPNAFASTHRHKIGCPTLQGWESIVLRHKAVAMNEIETPISYRCESTRSVISWSLR